MSYKMPFSFYMSYIASEQWSFHLILKNFIVKWAIFSLLIVKYLQSTLKHVYAVLIGLLASLVYNLHREKDLTFDCLIKTNYVKNYFW